MKRLVFGIVICFLVMAITAFSVTVQEGRENKTEIIEKSFSMDPARPARIEFRDVDGNLYFSSSPDNTVKIKITKEVRSRSTKKAERLLRDTRVAISQNGNSVDVRIKYPRFRGIFFWLSDYQRVKVTTEIQVPQKASFKADLVDGSINGNDFAGDLELDTVDGSIHLNRVQGSVKAHAVDGDMVFREMAGSVKAQTTDGKIQLSGDFKNLWLKSVDGDIQAELLPSSAMESDWEIRTVDGDVDILVPADFSSDFSLRSSDGRIRSEVPLTITGKVSEKRLEGKLRSGGRLFSIRTGDGHISLRKK
jgi:DUF4097 and DUF4098 domain-containing protein YvlB